MMNAQEDTLEKSQNIAVIGGREEASPFFAVGAAVFITHDTDAARKAVLYFADRGYPVILVSDGLIRYMEDILDHYSSSPVPIITSIPGRPGRRIPPPWE